ncbi:hypothetical protein LshimejAT787_0211570 [Lyophyllum shimeji]|uniref:RING-type domain-containing protein n=1 Tax=Lyophyllum shimeji TaxID=47721 RepID=A0A9P3UJM5_LYOSH|nr:hypothetical protein LshimejAT787_0211570 [Lyophyllum shimeji]
MGCGHGFCQECLRRIPRRRNHVACPTCRFETGQEPQQIYITFAGPTESRRRSVPEIAGTMKADSLAAALDCAVRKIKKEAKAKAAEARLLSDAAERVAKRLGPVFAALEREQAANTAIIDENKTLKGRLNEMESIRSQAVDLKTQLRDQNRMLNAVLTSLENTQAERERLAQLVTKLQRSLDKKENKLRTAVDESESMRSQTVNLKNRLRDQNGELQTLMESTQTAKGVGKARYRASDRGSFSLNDKDKQIHVLEKWLRAFTKEGKQTEPAQARRSLQIERPPESVQNVDSRLATRRRSAVTQPTGKT